MLPSARNISGPLSRRVFVLAACATCSGTAHPYPDNLSKCMHCAPPPVFAHTRRDLSSPFVSDLESLLEQLNPHYCRSSRQHTPPAVLAALSDGGALALHSFTTWPHSLAMARAGVLQDLLGGFAVVRPYLAASSSHRKAFHQVRGTLAWGGGRGEGKPSGNGGGKRCKCSVLCGSGTVLMTGVMCAWRRFVLSASRCGYHTACL
jgi:hypothetical protein